MFHGTNLNLKQEQIRFYPLIISIQTDSFQDSASVRRRRTEKKPQMENNDTEKRNNIIINGHKH